jgi:hypothetical protein
MLIGCCHCGETPSESTPPSQSASASILTLGCGSCRYGVAPQRIRVSIGVPGGSGPCCSHYSQPSYLCNWRSGSFGFGATCGGGWVSDAGPRFIPNNNPNVCNPPFVDNGGLVSVWLSNSFVGNQNVINAVIQFRGNSITYRHDILTIGYYNDGDVPCLTTNSLILISGGSNPSPCGTGWASSISMSPA